MSAQEENVHHLDDYKEKESVQEQYDNIPKEVLAATNKDMGKVAIAISLLSVVLLVVFFFGLNQNITGLSKEVQSLGGLKGEVASLKTSMFQMDSRLVELEKLPSKTRNLIIDQNLQEMASKTQYLSGQVEDKASGEKLLQVQKLLKEVQAGLVK